MSLSSHLPELASFEVLLAIAKTGSLGAGRPRNRVDQQAVSGRLAAAVPGVRRTRVEVALVPEVESSRNVYGSV
jgi:hypothetical protein